MLFANLNFKDLLVEGALFNSGIEIQRVSEHVWVGRGGLRGRSGELPAGAIRASQGTFSSLQGFCNYISTVLLHVLDAVFLPILSCTKFGAYYRGEH